MMYKNFFILFLLLFTNAFSDGVSFDKALGIDELGKKFVCKKEQDNERYSACLHAWKAQNMNRKGSIPKKIHFVWLQDKPLLKKNIDYIQYCKTLHPNHEIKLWTKADLAFMPKEFVTIIEQRKTIREKEDILRSAILLEYGGVVLDVEHECIRSLDDLLEHNTFIASLEVPLGKKQCKRRLHIATTFIAAIKAHPIIQRWLSEIIRTYSTNTHFDKIIAKSLQKETLQKWTPYLLFGKVVDEALEAKHSDAVVLPPTYAFPIRACWLTLYEKKGKKSFLESISELFQINPPLFSQIQPETLLVHHKGGSWQRD